MGIFRLFRKPKKESTLLICDVCRKPIDPRITPIPPGVVIDYKKGKTYSICGLCQQRLGLKATESGILIHGMKDGHGYVDIDIIERAVAENGPQPYTAEQQLAFYLSGLLVHQQALIESGYKFPKLEGKCPFCGDIVGETIITLNERPVYFYTCLNKGCTCELYKTHRYEYISFKRLQ
jgi:hypothetical protein